MTESRPVRVEAMTDEHADPVLAIYQAGIDTGNATFEVHVPAWADFTAGKLTGHSLVAVDGTEVLGWIAASATSSRPV